MANVKFEWNQDAIRKIERDAVAKLQPQVNAAVQDVLRDVAKAMWGQPADLVAEELTRRIESLGAIPDADTIQEYAAAISDKTLQGL